MLLEACVLGLSKGGTHGALNKVRQRSSRLDHGEGGCWRTDHAVWAFDKELCAGRLSWRDCLSRFNLRLPPFPFPFPKGAGTGAKHSGDSGAADDEGGVWSL